MLDYALFQPGSYWTYQDSITGHTRTMTVVSVQHDTGLVQYNDGRYQRGDDYSIYFEDTYDGAHWIWHVPFSFDITNVNYNQWSLAVHRSLSGFSSGSSGAMSVPALFGVTYEYNFDTVTYDPNYLAIIVNSISYDSVVRIKHSRFEARRYIWAAGGPACCEYYRKYFGIIRFELPDSNQVWNLVDYNLIQ